MKSAKNWLVQLYQPEPESVKWRSLLNFLGVESIPLLNEKELTQTLLHDQPGLIIFDRALFGEAFTAIESVCSQWLERGGGIALTGHAGLWPIPVAFHAKVVDIAERDPFMINALLQRYIPTYSRQHPRLETRLPGLYTRTAGNCQICEIMNLSPGGAFIRTTETLPLFGEELRVNVPLIGLRKEIELTSRVVRQILPNELNNYVQGIGVCFMGAEDSPVFSELNNYMRYVVAHGEGFDSQVTPFSGFNMGRNTQEVKSSPLREVKGSERSLLPNL